MKLCGDSDLFNIQDPCIRGSWAALLPTILILAICLSLVQLPLPETLRKLVNTVKSQFSEYLSLHDAEGLALADETSAPEAELEVDDSGVHLWRTVVFVFTGLLASLAWLADGYFLLMTGEPRWEVIKRCLVASTWLYTIVRPILRPTATPPYDLFTLYILHIAGGILQLGGYLFQRNAYSAPLPSKLVLVGLSANLAASVGLVVAILGMPLAFPSHLVKKEEIVSLPYFPQTNLSNFVVGLECLA